MPAGGTLTFDGQRIVLTGDLDADSVAVLWPQAEAFKPIKGGVYTADCSGVTRCAGAGVALLFRLEQRILDAGGKLDVTSFCMGMEQQFRNFESAEYDLAHPKKPPVKLSRRAFSKVGQSVVEWLRECGETLGYIGETLYNFVYAIGHPGVVRWRDFWVTCERAGVQAVPVVSLLGFLLGLILAFQSAIPMKLFGAQIYVASLVGISLIRELGPLITAILLTGRSGSAFAAEIGTMQVNEEIDALKTMGLSPVRFLALPRILAGVCIMPLLTAFANLAGLAGGLVVMISMDYSFVVYYNQLTRFISYGDLIGGLVKSMFFGLLVAAVGCQRGLATGKDAAAVGISTTSAVVSGIVLIAVADGLFAVLFYVMGW